MSDHPTGAGSSPKPHRLRWPLAVLALILVAICALIAGLLAGRGSEQPEPRTLRLAHEQVVSLADLRSFSHSLSYPLYWVGPAPRGAKLALSQYRAGRVYVRYLPAGVAAGALRREITIGTYPQTEAYQTVQAMTRLHGAHHGTAPGGALAVWDVQGAPNSVYMAFPGATTQIEVYSPGFHQARSLVFAGAVGQVR
jgi:hypothetical protein